MARVSSTRRAFGGKAAPAVMERRRNRGRRVSAPPPPVPAPSAEPLFPLRELPKYEALQAFAERFPDLDPGSAEAYFVLLRVATDILAAMDVHLARRGLSRGRFSVLMLLLREEGKGASPSVLARRSGVTRATITGLVDGLERMGLVRRKGVRADRRSHVVRLTTRGQRLLHAMLPAHLRRVTGLMANLTARQRRVLVELLAKVSEGLALIVEQ